MRLSLTDPAVVGILGTKANPRQVYATLPDYAHLDQLGGFPSGQQHLLQQLTEPGIAFVNAQIWQQASQIALARIFTGIGIPSGPVASTVLGVLGSFNPQLSSEQFLEQIAGSLVNALVKLSVELLTEAVNEGIGVAIGVVAAEVPVVGWAVKACWDLVTLIIKIAKIAKHQNDEEKYLYSPSVFSPSTDTEYLNYLLTRIGGNDWSNLFYPPSAGKQSSQGKAIYVSDLAGGGKRFVGNPNGERETTWYGFVPGTGWLHQAIETHGKNVIETGATLLPSSQKQCGWLWRQVSNTNSPATFSVHADAAEHMWHAHIEDLRQAIRASSLSSGMKAKIFKFYDRQWDPHMKKWSPIFGWGDGSKEVDYATGPLLRDLRKRQLQFCDTLTVAYVDNSFGAAQDPAVLAKISKRQTDLLEHPAVCDVDLSNVQDVLLHDEIFERRKGYKCLVAGSGQFLAPVDVPPPIVQGFATPHPLDLQGDRATWPLYVAGGVGLAAVGALGYYCRKDLEKTLRKLRLRIPI